MPQYVEAYGKVLEFPDGMSQADMASAIQKNVLSLAKKERAPDPTEGMSGSDKFFAGVGKGMTDVARGVRQFLPNAIGGLSRADIEEARRLDAPLMNTGAGMAGNIVGTAATLVPTAFLPGANTIFGASLIGAGTGLSQPSTSTKETLMNTTIGGVAAPLAIGAVRGAQAGYQGIRGLIDPFTQRGQQRIAADVVRQSATNPRNAAQAALAAREIVPGSEPTLAQVANDPGLAQLERTILNLPEYAPAVQQRQGAQRLARLNAVQDIAGRGDYLDDITRGRKLFAKEDYANAVKAGVDQDMAAALKPQIDSLMRRPSMIEAQKVAKRIAADRDIELNDFGSVEGLDWIKKALDKQINSIKTGTPIGKTDLDTLLTTKNDLMLTLEQISPAYAEANRNFAAMSGQINSAQVAQDLLNKLNKPGSRYMTAGTAREQGDAFMNALAQAEESVKKSTGMNRGIADVMAPADVRALQNVARDLGRKTFADTAGSAKGSPTAQNLASQNMLRRMIGPTGLPESWAESTMLQSLLAPVQGASRLTGANQRIMDEIAAAILDPQVGAGLLMTQPAVRNVGLLGAPNAQRYLPAAGLLPLGSYQ